MKSLKDEEDAIQKYQRELSDEAKAHEPKFSKEQLQSAMQQSFIEVEQFSRLDEVMGNMRTWVNSEIKKGAPLAKARNMDWHPVSTESFLQIGDHEEMGEESMPAPAPGSSEDGWDDWGEDDFDEEEW